ncbi:tetratricopeptide repeat protein [Candidatus Thiodiazotropha sp. CDECU1]|uniref:tetratricopeptide repeat protein n=1 Tax=Candidatus Thiodiazotropha sp. CDECU1 TaxID=3065865 RepID=UPI0029306911|nr:tetratricopeptide repeat protein [Candidatus Thiodiazotropha sp. CDECU1]
MHINQQIKHLLILPSLLLSACANNPTSTSGLPVTPEGGKQQTLQTQSSDGLSGDLIYNTLTGEIAAQRGHSKLAFEHALQAAKESRDESAAERATGLGLQANMPEAALAAATLWVEISPDSLKAHQIASVLYIRKSDLGQAVKQLQQVVKIANSQGLSGYLQAAAIAEKSGAPDQALLIMQQLVEEESQDPKALYALALTANRAKQHNLALDYVNRSLALNPASTQSLVLKTQTIIAMQQKEQGLEFIQQAYLNAPENTQLGKAYARILLEMDKTEEALDVYQSLYEQDPDDIDIAFSLGIINLQLERLDDAKVYLKRLVEKRQKRNQASFYLGMIAEEEKKPEQALGWYSRVEGKNLVDAQIRIAKILADQGNLDQARETLQRLRITQSAHEVKFYIIEAELLRGANDFESAHQVYTKALDIFEDNNDLLYARGLNAADLKRIDLLENDLRKILASQPDHADALNALGYTLADQTNRLDEAKGYIQQALALKPESPAILDSMGWVEYRMGNLEAALEFLNKAAEISPDAEIASHLGEVLWQLGQKERAIQVWNEANERDPDNRFINPVMNRLGAAN